MSEAPNQKRKPKEIILRLIILVVGLTIAHLGVTLFILSSLGSDPFNVLVRGVFLALESLTQIPLLTHGRTHMAICFIIIIVLLIVDKSYIKIGTVVCMFCGGPIIDLFTILLQNIINESSLFPIRLAALVAGCIILAFGMTIVIKSDAGTGPNDLVAVVISDKSKKPFSVIRIITDACFVLCGFLAGVLLLSNYTLDGIIGIGTIVCAFLVGPVSGIFLPINERCINKVLKRALK